MGCFSSGNLIHSLENFHSNAIYSIMFLIQGAAWIHFPRTDSAGNDIATLYYGKQVAGVAECLSHCVLDPRCMSIIDVPGSRCFTKTVNRWQKSPRTSSCCNYYDVHKGTLGNKESSMVRETTPVEFGNKNCWGQQKTSVSDKNILRMN